MLGLQRGRDGDFSASPANGKIKKLSKKNRARLKAAGDRRVQAAPHAGGPQAAMTENSDARTIR
jgi:hypothetical protein